MRVLPLLACATLILTLASVGVSWAIAGVGLCVFATTSLILVCSLSLAAGPLTAAASARRSITV
jgi:hypothetical protein